MSCPGSVSSRLASALLIAIVFQVNAAFAQVDPVTIDAPEKKVWVGQRAVFSVALHGGGPFVGAPSFSLPRIPRTVIVNAGQPVVSSKEIDGKSWFIQTHEFALFSQAAGKLEIPSFEVRFSTRDGFTGPQVDHVEQTPPLEFEIEQPPGRDLDGFLVTTDAMEITESWSPAPGAANVGDVFHRTITQKADQMTGMALAPPPASTPDGVRVYLAKPEVTDDTERGAFNGTRRDTITYLFQKPGILTIPAIQYVWWNPKKEQFGTKTLPAVSFDVAAPPVAKQDERTNQVARWVPWGVVVAIVAGVLLWWRRRIGICARAVWRSLHPPERVAARKLLSACRHDDAEAANAAWNDWRSTQPPCAEFSPTLQESVAELQRVLYGSPRSTAWRGDALAVAFRKQRARRIQSRLKRPRDLPPLNPDDETIANRDGVNAEAAQRRKAVVAR